MGLMSLTDGRLVADPRKGTLRVCQVGAAAAPQAGSVDPKVTGFMGSCSSCCKHAPHRTVAQALLHM